MKVLFSPPNLKNKIAVVAGATRGAGRGIAAALGEAGATVICTGRTTRNDNSRSDYKRPETIEETAELVTKLGGKGVSFAVDHLNTKEVEKLAETLRKEFGRIDILVNDIWGAEILKGGPEDWNTPIWKHDIDKGLRILRLAIDTHLITSHFLLPLLVQQRGGLVVEVTDGTNRYNNENYRISAFYDLAKVSVNRLGYSQGHELKEFGGTALSITPGWMRSEIMLEHFKATEDNWRAAEAPEGFLVSESTRYVGRSIAAIAADENKAQWNQKSVTAAEVAKHYGVTDVDGSQPDVWKYMEAEEKGLKPKPESFR